MIRVIFGAFLSLLICSSLFAGVCTRADLKTAADSYVSAQKAGNAALMALTDDVKYVENLTPSSMDRSILQMALPIDLQRSFLDTETCMTYTELVAAKTEEPLVMGVRLTWRDGKIAEINAIVTKEGDWKFDAAAYLTAAAKEDWGILPENQRTDRAALIAAANAYFDMFTYESVTVPWGIPCAHLEGGSYTGDGPRTTCKTGIPLEGIEIVDRSFVVDTEAGVVNAFSRFGVTSSPRFGKTDGLPDAHTFRLIKGKLRYIHSISSVN